MSSIKEQENWRTAIDLKAVEKLSVEERILMIEAIEKTLGEAYWQHLDTASETNSSDTDNEDIRLAQQELETYKANPGTGISWEDFYKKEESRLSKSE